MERFTKLFGSLIVFVYHCFDRVVIHGYLSGLSRPEQVVYFFGSCRESVKVCVLRGFLDLRHLAGSGSLGC
jgi:hypothetical protein